MAPTRKLLPRIWIFESDWSVEIQSEHACKEEGLASYIYIYTYTYTYTSQT